MDALLFPGLTPTRHRQLDSFISGHPGARNRFEECSEVLGYDLEDRYRQAEVYDWEPYQTVFLAVNLAIAEWAVLEEGITPSAISGQSFGGFAAAVHADALSLNDMVRLLRESTRVETEYFGSNPEELACVFFSHVRPEPVEDLMGEAETEGGWLEVSVRHDRGVYGISGTRDAVDRLSAVVRKNRGVVFYVMNRAEHCSRLHALRENLRREVYQNFTFASPHGLLISDVTGDRIVSGEGLAADLLDGWTQPTDVSVLYDGLSSIGIDRLVVPGPKTAFRKHGEGRFAILGVSAGDVMGGRK